VRTGSEATPRSKRSNKINRAANRNTQNIAPALPVQQAQGLKPIERQNWAIFVSAIEHLAAQKTSNQLVHLYFQELLKTKDLTYAAIDLSYAVQTSVTTAINYAAPS
jgi:hypothetical protein